MRQTNSWPVVQFSTSLIFSIAALTAPGRAGAARPADEAAEPAEKRAGARADARSADDKSADDKSADDKSADEKPDAPPEKPTPPPPPVVEDAEADEAPHKLEFYGLLVPAVEITSSFGANDIAMTPDSNASSVRGGSFSGPYTSSPANQPARFRTISAPSNIGVRGRWEFGSHHYGRFQWEVGSLTFGGTQPVTMYSPGLGLVSRNSGVFVGGPWGEIGFGIWDTPFSLMGNYAPAYGHLINASTLMSSSILGGLPFANGAVPGFPAQNFCITETDPRNALSFTPALAADLTQCANNAMNFDRRASNSIIYQSPTLAGLAFRTQAEVNFRRTSDFDNPPRNPWASSNSLTYTAGGLFAAVGFENRHDYVADAVQTARMLVLGGNMSTQAQWSGGGSGVLESREQGIRVNLRYTAPFGLTLGLLVEQLDYYAKYATLTPGDITTLRKQAGRMELIYHSGRHTVGGAVHRALPITGQIAAPNVLNAEGSGAWGVTAGYSFRLAKGLFVTAYFMTIINEVNARYNVVFQGLPSPAGADLRAAGTGFRYAF